VTDEAAAADKAAQAAVDQATATQKAHAEALKETTQALQDQITALDKQAQAAERADQDRIAGLQQGLQALQDQAQADADAFAALEKPLQDAATAAQDAATQHAGMYQAILAGDVDYYEQLIGKEDDLTAKIREKWDAEYSGLLRQKNGDDQRLFEAQAKQHQTDYELDKQILAARTAGNSAEVARLERQKALKDQQARADMQVLQDAAAVSADNEKRAHDQLDKDAKAQADQDAVKKKHADDALKAVQDQAAAKKQADDDAIKRQEAAIKEAQDQEQKDRRYWDDRKQALQDQLSAIQRNGQAQADADQRAIDAANQQKKIVDDTWNDRVQAAKDALKQAQDEQKALDDEATKQQKNLDLIKQQIAAQDQYNQKVDQTNQKLDQTNDKLKTANRQADQTDVTGTPLDQSRPANGGEAPPPALPATEGPRTSQAPQQPQVAAAAATPPQVVNFHFPNVTGALTPDTAQQAGATAAKSFAAAYRDATTSGAGRVGVNTA
ncbi:MAG TPA: hypothetical protein VFL91_00720, partial [Thermomicrobiales bacterium]|nr:hypothetical protein [Thermomicrobiales bacterium]